MHALSKLQAVLLGLVLVAVGFGAGFLLFADSDKEGKPGTESAAKTDTKKDAAKKYSGPCANPDALRDLEFFKEADKAYKKLAGKAGAECAVAGLIASKALQKKAEDPPRTADQLIEDARRLRASGFDELAKAKVKTLVEKHPKRSVPTDLRSTDKRLGWWQGVLTNVVPLARVAAEMFIALLVLFLLAVFVRRLVQWLCRGRRYARVDPVVGSDDAALSASLPSALAEHLEQLRTQGLGHSAMVGAAEADFALPEAVSGAFAPANVIVGLLELVGRFTPQRVRVIALTLRPNDPFRGLGVTVAIQKTRKRPVDATTLWERDFGLFDPDADDAGKEAGGRYQRLMLPAAAWLAYQPELGFDEAAINNGKSKAPLGTKNWRSYAHFAVGAVAQRRANDKLAESQYLQALDADPANQGARLNLAQLYLVPPHDPPPGQRHPTAEYLKRLTLGLDLLVALTIDPEDKGDKTADPDEMWFRGRYTQAVAYLYADKLAKAEASITTLRPALGKPVNEKDLDDEPRDVPNAVM